MPDPIAEFHRANRQGNDARFSRAHNAGLVLGYYDCYPGFGLQPGSWRAKDEYPPEFLTMCAEACVTPKRIVRDIQAYDHYLRLRGWCVDAPGWLVENQYHPRQLRRKGLGLGHFAEIRELANRLDIGPHQQLYYLADAAEAGWGALAMRKTILEVEESNGETPPEPMPQVWARAILPRLRDLADTDYDNPPKIQRAARLLVARLSAEWGEL